MGYSHFDLSLHLIRFQKKDPIKTNRAIFELLLFILQATMSLCKEFTIYPHNLQTMEITAENEERGGVLRDFSGSCERMALDDRRAV